MRRIFIIALFILCFSLYANAQGGTDYRFLEVVDFDNKPVADATVSVKVDCDGADKKTNEKGLVERFPIGGGDCGNLYDFSISKDGYYPFRDIGLFSSPHNDIYRKQFFYDLFRSREKYKIELLKIPRNKLERKAIGNQQRKRELFWAVRDRKTAEVRRLLKSGLNPNLTTADLRTVLAPLNLPAIIYSAALGDIETVKEFLKAGVDLRQKNSPARDILLYYLAANPNTYSEPKTEIEKAESIRFQNGLDFLIAAGADLTVTTKNDETLLMIAAKTSDLRMVKTLLDRNSAVNETDRNGQTALTLTTSYNYSNTPHRFKIAELLLQKGADPNVLAFNNDDGSETYCTSPLINAVVSRNPALVKLLLANNANIDLACKSGKTAVKISLQDRWDKSPVDLEIRKLLIQKM